MIYRNRKTKRKETPKPDPSKIQTGSKIIYFSPISIQLQQKILRILNIFNQQIVRFVEEISKRINTTNIGYLFISNRKIIVI